MLRVGEKNLTFDTKSNFAGEGGGVSTEATHFIWFFYFWIAVMILINSIGRYGLLIDLRWRWFFDQWIDLFFF